MGVLRNTPVRRTAKGSYLVNAIRGAFPPLKQNVLGYVTLLAVFSKMIQFSFAVLCDRVGTFISVNSR